MAVEATELALPNYQDLLGVPYNLEAGPSPTPEQNLQKGINCQRLTQILFSRGLAVVTGDPNFVLNPYFRSKEIFEGFDPVDPSNVQPLDVVFYTLLDRSDPRFFHQAVVINRLPTGEPILIHASPEANGVAIWRHTEFYKYERYPKVMGVRRYPERLESLAG